MKGDEVTPDHVAIVSGKLVSVRCADSGATRAALPSVTGCRTGSGFLEISFESDQELASIFASLRDAGVAFVHVPHGWPPAAEFERLREKGLLSGSYTSITWTDPDRYLVTLDR